MTYMAQRVSNFGTTIFAEMTNLAVEHNALNLGQGFPDFPSPAFIKQAAIKAIQGDVNQYAPGNGRPSLREAASGNPSCANHSSPLPNTLVVTT